MRELEKKALEERDTLVRNMGAYLNSSGIPAEVREESIKGQTQAEYIEPVIYVSDRHISTIRIQYQSYVSCGMFGHIMRFIYQIPLKSGFSRALQQAVMVRTKPVREKKLGVFSGKVIDVEWSGRELARALNSDTAIHSELQRCCQSYGKTDILVQADAASISIMGPTFPDSVQVLDLFELSRENVLEDCVFGFALYDRIAGHIREVLKAHQAE